MEEFTLPMPGALLSTLIVPGPIYDPSFRAHFITALWAYAQDSGALTFRNVRKEVKPKDDPYERTVDELSMLAEWLPMPIPGRSQGEMIDAFLLQCKTKLKTKCSGDAISDLAQAALKEAIKHPPPVCLQTTRLEAAA